MKSLSKVQFILLFTSIGFLFPILAWLIELGKTGEEYSIYWLLNAHYNNPSLIVINLIPVVFFVISYIIANRKEEIKEKFNTVEDQLSNQAEILNRVTYFAEKIGKGHYDIDFQATNKSDVLGNTLENLRKKLYDNKQKEYLQNWEMVGKDKINEILRRHNDINLLSYDVLKALIEYLNVVQGVIYIYNEEKDVLYISSAYAYDRQKFLKDEVKVGEGLVGQAAIEKDIVYRVEIPEDYFSITSGILGEKKPDSILVVPLLMEEKLQGVFEFASIRHFKTHEIEFSKNIAEIVAQTIYNLKITEKTERLLKESQKMTQELRENEEELRQNAEEMRMTQEELEKTNINLEEKVEEVNRSQKKLHSLLENASELILIYDKDKELKYVSPSAKNIIGFSEEEIFERKDSSKINKKGYEDINNMLDSLLNRPEKHQRIEYSYMSKDGNILFLESIGHNLLHNPAINGLLLNINDITERKRAEKEQRMRGRMQTLSDNSPDVIIRLDLNKKIFYANPVIEKYSKFKANEFNNKKLKDVSLQKEITDIIDKLIDIAKEKQSEFKKVKEQIQFFHDEETKIFDVNAIPEYNDEEALETILFIIHDITELKKIEQVIKEKNEKITDSINYALRLQNAILPNQKSFKRLFNDSFMFYLPKDIVSGDFPWVYEKGDDIYVAAIDFTGHGVPGAMLSLIGYFLMNQIVSEPEDYKPSEVLNFLHKGVQKTLKQDEDEASARDGMDVALCKINKKKNTLQFSGAHRPLYHIRNGELTEYKGTRKAIGGIPKEGIKEPEFKNYVLDIQENDAIYIFSDGLPDQFGGPEGRKYFPKRIKQGIVDNNDKPMNEIYSYFKNDYYQWLGDYKSIDDVLLIGIRF